MGNNRQKDMPDTISVDNNNHESVSLKIIKTERQLNKQWYIIHVMGSLKRGQNYQVNLKFTGALLTNSKDGFFQESYVHKQSGEKK